MDMRVLLAMASFALVASVTPGPVNTLALASGVHHGFRRSLGFVAGATVGFTLLLLSAGAGMAAAVSRLPLLDGGLRVAGVGFMLYLAARLWGAEPGLGPARMMAAPSFWTGACLQWLNPKAWIAAIAGMGAYGLAGGMRLVLAFAGIYFVVCFASIALWAYAGRRLTRVLGPGGRMRLFNRAMAALLAVGAVGMLAGG